MNGLGRKNDAENEKSSVFTRETLGVVLVLFATLCLVCLISRDSIFYTPGKIVNAFLGGAFGYFSYLVTIGVIIKGISLILDKKMPFKAKTKFLVTMFFIVLATILHVISMRGQELGFGEYVNASYNMAEQGIKTASAGGLCVSLLAYWCQEILSEVGTYVVLGAIEVIIIYLLVRDGKNQKNAEKEQEKFKSSFVKTPETVGGISISGERDYPVANVNYQTSSQQKLFVNNANDFSVKTKREKAREDENPLKVNYGQSGFAYCESSESYSKIYGEDLKKKLDYIKTPPTIEVKKNDDYSAYPTMQSTTHVSDYISQRKEEKPEEVKRVEIPMIEHDEAEKFDSAKSHAQDFAEKYAEFSTEESVQDLTPNQTESEFTDEEITLAKEEYLSEISDTQEVRASNFLIDENEKEETVYSEPEAVEPPQSIVSDRRSRGILFGEEKPEQKASGETAGFTSRASSDRVFGNLSPASTPEVNAETEKPKKKPPINRKYVRPPLDLLERYNVQMDQTGENHEQRMEIIQRTLEEFHINAIPQSYVQGPTVTRYEIMMPAGISVKKVLNFDDDLKMRLESKNGVRIEAPIPGKNLVGIEVANKTKVTVGLREIIEASASKPSKPGSLIFALGKDIVGNAITDNLAKGPHYLVAGATGSGKSVCLNVMIISLIMRYSPEELRLILIDPKSVGFRIYEHIPHLLIDEIVTDAQKTLTILQWAYDEMEKRYKTFAECPGVISDIDAYNSEIAGATVAKMPRIVIVIDELADLMETCKKDMEARIRALAQKARAAGIHLVLATQRPSVDIITGTIKANLPSRIALKVMNFADSNTIMSEGGAEKLLGNGDMLFKNSGMAETERYQGAWISDREINNVVTFIKENNEAYFDEELQECLNKANKPSSSDDSSVSGADDNEFDDLFLKSLWFVINTGTAAISQLQRRFSIGYPRAGSIIDKMERLKFIGPNEGSKTRRVLITREEFEEKFGPMSDQY